MYKQALLGYVKKFKSYIIIFFSVVSNITTAITINHTWSEGFEHSIVTP